MQVAVLRAININITSRVAARCNSCTHSRLSIGRLFEFGVMSVRQARFEFDVMMVFPHSLRLG